MNDSEKTYTEREVIKRERMAFCKGAGTAMSYLGWEALARRADWPGSNALAERKYPLPTITRARVVRDAMYNAYRILDGDLQIQYPDSGKWQHVLHLKGNADLVRDLLANPTEEVEA